MKTYLRFAEVVGIALAAIGVIVLLRYGPSLAMAQVPPNADELRLALHRVALTPERLTAAGLSSTDAEAVVGDVSAHLTENPDLEADYDSYFLAKRDHDRLARSIRAGNRAAQDLSDFAAAQTSLASTEQSLNTALDALFAAGIVDLTTTEQAILTRLRANQTWTKEEEYATVDRTEVDWVRLRDALANERISAELGEAPDVDDQAFLTQVRADPTVSTATANLDVNLAAITTAWGGAIEQ